MTEYTVTVSDLDTSVTICVKATDANAACEQALDAHPWAWSAKVHLAAPQNKIYVPVTPAAYTGPFKTHI